MQDYTQLIQRVIQPEIVETEFRKPWDALVSNFTVDSKKYGGDRISFPMRMSSTSSASAFTRADKNPEAGNFVIKYPYWQKLYYHTAVEVHGLDEVESQNGGAVSPTNLIQDAIREEMPNFWQVLYNAVYAQLKADFDSSATFSAAALSRTTYPTIASYEEDTDTAVTIALVRTMMQQTVIDKITSGAAGYTMMMEQAVYNKFKPLAAALMTWNINDASANQPQDMGYQDVGTFEGSKVIVPQGMTTGDIFYFRKQDVHIVETLPFMIEQEYTNKFTNKFIIRQGFNLYTKRPGLCGKMTSKD
jgi:hypothetical protein